MSELNPDCHNFIGPYPCCSIITGDSKVLAPAIPDESVDLIFTDPVYDRIEDYRWLAETASRMLKDDRYCLVHYGIGYLPEVTAALSKFLAYEWHHVLYMPTLNARGAYRTFSNYRGLLRYRKGTARPSRHMRDLHIDSYLPKNDGHQWAKNLDIVVEFMDVFSKKNGVVVDFFAGQGAILGGCRMLGRHYLAFEIDPDVAERARERVFNTQTPLTNFVMPEQPQLM